MHSLYLKMTYCASDKENTASMRATENGTSDN